MRGFICGYTVYSSSVMIVMAVHRQLKEFKWILKGLELEFSP